MGTFTVSAIIDGDTFEVKGGWKWNGETGSRVRPTGYDAAELRACGGQTAKDKLQRLILGKEVELRQAHTIDRGRLVCDVFFNGHNLADYFATYQPSIGELADVKQRRDNLRSRFRGCIAEVPNSFPRKEDRRRESCPERG